MRVRREEGGQARRGEASVRVRKQEGERRGGEERRTEGRQERLVISEGEGVE